MWITGSLAEIGWLELWSRYLSVWLVFSVNCGFNGDRSGFCQGI